MAQMGPVYEKQASEVKRGLFEGFITTQQNAPITLLEVGAGTLPNAAYYTVCMLSTAPAMHVAVAAIEPVSWESSPPGAISC